jgi:hypothetical protein
MLYREIMAVCSEINTKHINTLCGQNIELLNVKLAVQWAVELWDCIFYQDRYICSTERQHPSAKETFGKGSSPR